MSAWVRGIVYTAFVCSVLQVFIKSGKLREVLNICCGLAIIISVIAPIKDFAFNSYSLSMAKYREDAEAFCDEGNANRENLNRTYIEEKYEAYILDKAKVSNADICNVKVGVEWSSEGLWYPVSAEITYNCGEIQKDEIAESIEAELGISKANQKWSKSDEN